MKPAAAEFFRKPHVGFCVLLSAFAAIGQAQAESNRSCLPFSATASLCLTENAPNSDIVAISGDQIVYLPDPHVHIELTAVSYDPQSELTRDYIAAVLSTKITLQEGETLRTLGVQRSFLDWGNIDTQDYEIRSQGDTCAVLASYRTVEQGTLAVIWVYFCPSTGARYCDIAHEELLKSIWINWHN